MLVNQIVKYEYSADRLSAIFSALGDPTRLAILERLTRGDATVKELAEPFKITLPAISRHLKVLERVGLISRKHKAQWRQCTLEADALREVLMWADRYRQMWDESFDGLNAYLEVVQKNNQEDHHD